MHNFINTNNSNHLKRRDQIRKTVHRHLQALSPNEREIAANTLKDNVLRHPALAKAKKIAIFLPLNGEINTAPLIKALWDHEKHIYLPRIHPFNSKYLLFQRYMPISQLTPGTFGILSPTLNVTYILPTHQLDILFIPLVAFDRQGHRLGMGGGYYDRLLGCYQTYPFSPIGIAYSCQEVDHIPEQDWDKSIPEIITDKEHILCL